MDVCSVSDCSNPVEIKSRGWCRKHYQRWWSQGDPEKTTTTPRGDTEKFINNLLGSPPTDDCIDWPFCIGTTGYAKISRGGRTLLVTRIVLSATSGDAPSQKHQAAHACGNRQCVNPRHLYWATQVENERDKLIHGTLMFGDKSNCTKLSEDDVAQIKTLCKSSKQRDVAKMFGVSESHVSSILSGRKRARG